VSDVDIKFNLEIVCEYVHLTEFAQCSSFDAHKTRFFTILMTCSFFGKVYMNDHVYLISVSILEMYVNDHVCWIVMSILEMYVDEYVYFISWSMLELYFVLRQYFSNLIHNLCQLVGIVGACWVVHILGPLLKVFHK